MDHYGSFPSPCSDRTPSPKGTLHSALLAPSPPDTSLPFSPCSSSGVGVAVAGGVGREPSFNLAQARSLSTANPCKYPQRALPRQHFQPWFDPPKNRGSASLCSSMVNLNFSSEEPSQKFPLFSARAIKSSFKSIPVSNCISVIKCSLLQLVWVF